MSVLLILAAVAAASLAGDPQSARLLNGTGIVTADDYPLVSLTRGEEGTVTVRLQVDPVGVVEQCDVAESSGHPALDEQTRAVFRARARFEPARDEQGRAVADKYKQRVTWKIERPRAVPMPRQAWVVRDSLYFSGDGAVVDCKSEVTGAPLSRGDCKGTMNALTQSLGLARAPASAPIAAVIITEAYFYPLPPAEAPDPPAMRQATETARQVSEVIIEPDGTISACKGLHYSGEASPANDACLYLRNHRFEPAAPGSKPLVGTVVITGYLRSQNATS